MNRVLLIGLAPEAVDLSDAPIDLSPAATLLSETQPGATGLSPTASSSSDWSRANWAAMSVAR